MPGLQLYDHQQTALEKMKNGCILCGDVGSGKSRTALAYYYICNGGKIKTDSMPYMTSPCDLFIITTARKRDTLEWEDELIPFLLSTTTEFNHYHNRVIVDSWNNIGKYIAEVGAFFIFDEQRVVGKGAWVKSFLKIAKANQWILLSATPGDTWMDYLPVFLANGYFRNRTEFLQNHVIYSRYCDFPKVERYVGTGKLEKFRREILVYMDFNRHTKSHHIDIFADWDTKAYRTTIKDRWNIWENCPLVNAGELCYSLRRIVNSDLSRVHQYLDILHIHPKAIVFYNFDYELEILRNAEYEKGTTIAEWNGHKHEPIPEGDKWVYLVQYTAGAEGWNCITTDTVIFYSQNYSYKVMVQAQGRIDRLNTPFTDLWYYHLKSKSSIDLTISRAIANKKQFNENRLAKRFIDFGTAETEQTRNLQVLL